MIQMNAKKQIEIKALDDKSKISKLLKPELSSAAKLNRMTETTISNPDLVKNAMHAVEWSSPVTRVTESNVTPIIEASLIGNRIMDSNLKASERKIQSGLAIQYHGFSGVNEPKKEMLVLENSIHASSENDDSPFVTSNYASMIGTPYHAISLKINPHLNDDIKQLDARERNTDDAKVYSLESKPPTLSRRSSALSVSSSVSASPQRDIEPGIDDTCITNVEGQHINYSHRSSLAVPEKYNHNRKHSKMIKEGKEITVIDSNFERASSTPHENNYYKDHTKFTSDTAGLEMFKSMTELRSNDQIPIDSGTKMNEGDYRRANLHQKHASKQIKIPPFINIEKLKDQESVSSIQSRNSVSSEQHLEQRITEKSINSSSQMEQQSENEISAHVSRSRERRQSLYENKRQLLDWKKLSDASELSLSRGQSPLLNNLKFESVIEERNLNEITDSERPSISDDQNRIRLLLGISKESPEIATIGLVNKKTQKYESAKKMIAFSAEKERKVSKAVEVQK